VSKQIQIPVSLYSRLARGAKPLGLTPQEYANLLLERASEMNYGRRKFTNPLDLQVTIPEELWQAVKRLYRGIPFKDDSDLLTHVLRQFYDAEMSQISPGLGEALRRLVELHREELEKA